MNKAVFLDVQGTLGGGGLDDISTFSFFPCAIEAIKMLNANDILAIAITNQSHIAKGLLTMVDFNKKITNMQAELERNNARLDAVYCCPHGDQDNCACRKPLTGMVEQAKADFNIDLRASFVVGDMGSSDMVLAKTAGAKGVLVLTGIGQGSLTTFRHTWSGYEADHVAQDVLDAVKWIVVTAIRIEQVIS